MQSNDERKYSIHVFRLEEEVQPFLERISASNQETLERFGSKCDDKRREYGKKFGLCKLPGEEIRFNPREEKDFRAHYGTNLGSGFEFTVPLLLEAFGDEYYYEVEGSLPVSKSTVDSYNNIDSLVEGVRAYLTQASTQLLGAVTAPYLFTINQRRSLLTAETRKVAKEYLAKLEGGETEGSEVEECPELTERLSEEEKKMAIDLFTSMAGEESIYRGLNQKERRKFERFFNKIFFQQS